MGVVPVTWSRMLSGGKPVPAFLAAFAPKVRDVSSAAGSSATAAGGISLESVLEMVKRVDKAKALLKPLGLA